MRTLSILFVIFGFQMAFAGHHGDHGKAKKMDKMTKTAAKTNCTDFSKYGDVPTMEMQKIVKAGGATIIDVNSDASFKKNRIPGAIHFASNQKMLGKVLPKDKNTPVIAYCGGKSCTAWQKAAKMACEMGYKNIRHFSEGITGWKNIKKG